MILGILNIVSFNIRILYRISRSQNVYADNLAKRREHEKLYFPMQVILDQWISISQNYRPRSHLDLMYY